MTEPDGTPLVDFVEVMRRLRAECPWKSSQTHRSLARYLLEETHETLEAIDTGDADHLREELGDLLLQVYFHAEIASEAGAFDIDDVARGLTEKMVRRNRHVFGEVPQTGLSVAEVEERWQAAKATEQRRSSITEALPPGLPALLYADKVLGRLAAVGRHTSSDPSVEQRMTSAELGERLLDLVREGHAAGLDPEQALRDVVRSEVAAADDRTDAGDQTDAADADQTSQTGQAPPGG